MHPPSPLLVGRHLHGPAEVHDECLCVLRVHKGVLEGQVGVADSLGVDVLQSNEYRGTKRAEKQEQQALGTGGIGWVSMQYYRGKYEKAVSRERGGGEGKKEKVCEREREREMGKER